MLVDESRFADASSANGRYLLTSIECRVDATIQERAWLSPIWYTPDPSLVKKAAFYPDLHQVFN